MQYCGCIYDSNKHYITNITAERYDDIDTFVINNPNAAYMRLNLMQLDKNTSMVIKGSTSDFPAEFVPYYNKTTAREDISLNELQKSEVANIGNKWQGKIWHGFGTSITNTSSEGKYPTYLSSISGLSFVNHGYSGGCIGTSGEVAKSQILTQIDNADLSNADLVTIEGFVNDWAQQVPIGNITDKTSSTFCGAIYLGITKVLAKTNALLIFLTDHTGQIYDNKDISRTAERVGKTQYDYRKAVIDMCNYMNIPVIDVGGKCMISEDTATMYLIDQIHHTQLGGKQYAQTIWNELKNISPRETV